MLARTRHHEDLAFRRRPIEHSCHSPNQLHYTPDDAANDKVHRHHQKAGHQIPVYDCDQDGARANHDKYDRGGPEDKPLASMDYVALFHRLTVVGVSARSKPASAAGYSYASPTIDRATASATLIPSTAAERMPPA